MCRSCGHLIGCVSCVTSLKAKKNKCPRPQCRKQITVVQQFFFPGAEAEAAVSPLFLLARQKKNKCAALNITVCRAIAAMPPLRIKPSASAHSPASHPHPPLHSSPPPHSLSLHSHCISSPLLSHRTVAASHGQPPLPPPFASFRLAPLTFDAAQVKHHRSHLAAASSLAHASNQRSPSQLQQALSTLFCTHRRPQHPPPAAPSGSRRMSAPRRRRQLERRLSICSRCKLILTNPHTSLPLCHSHPCPSNYKAE